MAMPNVPIELLLKLAMEKKQREQMVDPNWSSPDYKQPQIPQGYTPPDQPRVPMNAPIEEMLAPRMDMGTIPFAPRKRFPAMPGSKPVEGYDKIKGIPHDIGKIIGMGENDRLSPRQFMETTGTEIGRPDYQANYPIKPGTTPEEPGMMQKMTGGLRKAAGSKAGKVAGGAAIAGILAKLLGGRSGVQNAFQGYAHLNAAQQRKKEADADKEFAKNYQLELLKDRERGRDLQKEQIDRSAEQRMIDKLVRGGKFEDVATLKGDDSIEYGLAKDVNNQRAISELNMSLSNLENSPKALKSIYTELDSLAKKYKGVRNADELIRTARLRLNARQATNKETQARRDTPTPERISTRNIIKDVEDIVWNSTLDMKRLRNKSPHTVQAKDVVLEEDDSRKATIRGLKKAYKTHVVDAGLDDYKDFIINQYLSAYGTDATDPEARKLALEYLTGKKQ